MVRPSLASTVALPDPDRDFGWALGTVARAYLRRAEASMQELPGGPRGFQVLSIAGSGQCRSQAAIAERVGIDRTVLTYLLDELEALKLVRRTPDPVDRRARQVTLTAKGTRSLAKLAERTAAIENDLLAGITGSDAEVFRATLFRAAHSVDGATPGENICEIARSIDAAASSDSKECVETHTV